MNRFELRTNDYLRRCTTAFYHTDYVGYRQPGNPDYVNCLKNTFGKELQHNLDLAREELRQVLEEDLPKIPKLLKLSTMTVCVVPRAKAESAYSPNQRLFRSTVCDVVRRLPYFEDGIQYIIRHTNTQTTHLRKASNLQNEGREPYPGITADTCDISNDVAGRDILLIDDI